MNRSQRRRAQKIARRADKPSPEPIREVKIGHGHNGEHVFFTFSPKVDNVTLTLEQAEAFHAAFGRSLENFKEHLRGKQN